MKLQINQFIGKSQLAAIIYYKNHGEEKDFYKNLLIDLTKHINTMPKTYETGEQGDAALIQLHYFNGGSDWWILERDIEDEQLQAFGFACLNGDTHCAELGYISIQELITHNVELDLYYHPQTLGQVKDKLYKRAA